MVTYKMVDQVNKYIQDNSRFLTARVTNMERENVKMNLAVLN